MKVYKSTLTEEQASDYTKALQQAKPPICEKAKLGKPKHPRNSMVMYQSAHRGTGLKEARKIWKQLDDSQKEVYVEQSRKEQEQYK